MRTVVGVLRGGPSSEYEVSLKTGASVLEHLDRERYEPRDLFVDREGVWHSHGVPAAPERVVKGVDVVFNALHGEYGESGEVQRTLDRLSVPYTGAGALPSALAFHKQHAKDIVKKHGIKVPYGKMFDFSHVDDFEDAAQQIFRTFPHPAIVKPVAGGSSVGMELADTYHALLRALKIAADVSPKVLVEEFITGREATVGVIDNFRNESLYALPPIEIIPPAEQPFFTYDAKYSGLSQEICPGNFNDKEKQELIRVAKLAHEKLELSHYSRSDFVVSRRGIYFLEVNPAAGVGMTSESLFPKALKAVGAKLSDFLHHVIELARRR